jgi:hypothetical protein
MEEGLEVKETAKGLLTVALKVRGDAVAVRVVGGSKVIV